MVRRAGDHGKAGCGARPAGWHVLRDGPVLLLARRLPARFDLSAAAVLRDEAATVGRGRLAHQVRQDVWRCLRGLRGFCPVVRVERRAGALHLTAGGAVRGMVLARAARLRAEALLADLLDCPRNRARWLRHAGGAV